MFGTEKWYLRPWSELYYAGENMRKKESLGTAVGLGLTESLMLFLVSSSNNQQNSIGTLPTKYYFRPTEQLVRDCRTRRVLS